LRQRRPQVGAPVPSPASGQPVVVLVVPVLGRQGEPLGAVAAEIDLRATSAYLDRVPLIHGASAAIVTSAGTLLARTGADPRALGQPFRVPPRAAPLIRERTGLAEWRWDGGVSRLTAAAPMTQAPWVALGAMPRDLAYAPAAAGLRRNLLG